MLWQKFKDKIKLVKLQELLLKKFRYGDYLFALIVFGLVCLFWEDYKTVWNSNGESLLLAFPFLLVFAWLAWRGHRRNKPLSREVLLSAVGVFLAAWIFIFQTTDSNVSQTDLIISANTYNCRTATNALTIDPSSGLLLTPFIIDPYLNNPDMVFRLYGNPYALNVLGAVLTMESANNLINLVGSLSVQAANPTQSPYATQLILKYNSQLIQSANSIINILCVPRLGPKQSWLTKMSLPLIKTK